jgi:hypothetical protein
MINQDMKYITKISVQFTLFVKSSQMRYNIVCMVRAIYYLVRRYPSILAVRKFHHWGKNPRVLLADRDRRGHHMCEEHPRSLQWYCRDAFHVVLMSVEGKPGPEL